MHVPSRMLWVQEIKIRSAAIGREAIRCRLMLGVRNGPFSPFCKGLEAVEGAYHRESHPRHPMDVEDVERKIDVQYMVVTLL